jgi:hypothetical protein
MELYTMPSVVIKISQSVAKFGLINLRLYKEIITTANILPKRSAGSTIILIILNLFS